MKCETSNWGRYQEKDVFLYCLTNANGVSVRVTNFGASIVGIITPDTNGHFADVALGYDDLAGYVNDGHYMGAIVGRFANRIAGGLVKLDGKNYQLTVKEGGFHHHGGKIGFNKKVWDSIYLEDKGMPSVRLNYLSPDGEEGFPGNLDITVTYTLNNQNQLIVDYSATTDKTTLINVTQHTYFNLAGHNSGTVLKQELMMPLDNYLPVTGMHVPDGSIADVTGTPFDFRKQKAIGKDIDEPHPFLTMGRGYDNSWVIKKKSSPDLKVAARAYDPASGRVLMVYTTEPSLHLYTSNWLTDTQGKNGAVYNQRDAFCIETQHYPDAPNHANFPSTVLRKGTLFKSRTIFEFDVVAKTAIN